MRDWSQKLLDANATMRLHSITDSTMPTDNTNGTQEQPDKEDPVIAFRCPAPLKKQVRVAAAQYELSVQEICIRALRQYLAELVAA